MSHSRSFTSVAMIFVVVAMLLAVTAFLVLNSAKKSSSELPVLGNVPEFNLMTSDNSEFGLSDLKGKVSVVDFMFTRCLGPCPVMSANMSDLYQTLSGQPEIQMVSITVDPDYDTPEILTAYGTTFNVNDNRWLFITGEIDSIAALCEGGFMLAADNLPGAHSTKFILVDQLGQIRGYYDGRESASIAVLKADLRKLAEIN